jgi:DNA-binding phage protein
MDQGTLVKVARLRTMAARQGRAFDVVRFAQDHKFAEQTLHSVLDTDNEALLLLGLEVMQALGMVRVAAPAQPKPVPEKAPAPALDQRYVGRLR